MQRNLIILSVPSTGAARLHVTRIGRRVYPIGDWGAGKVTYHPSPLMAPAAMLQCTFGVGVSYQLGAKLVCAEEEMGDRAKVYSSANE